VAESGDMVVPLLGEGATGKDIDVAEQEPALRPKNLKHRRIPIARREDVRIVRKVVGVGGMDFHRPWRFCSQSRRSEGRKANGV